MGAAKRADGDFWKQPRRFVRESERIEKERLQSAPRAAESEPSLLQEFQSVGLRSLLHCY
jgi:hypothetical protein